MLAYVSANSASNGHPSITAEPAGVTVTKGQTATFTVAAAGRGPLNYQWQKNGAAISGATFVELCNARDGRVGTTGRSSP